MVPMVNEAVISLINEGFLSTNKIHKLIEVKEMVDRISRKKYIEEHDARELFNKYGVMPNIVTWGDYFQTELATTLKDLSDSAFDRVIDTVRFDLMASYMIFSEQSSQFFEWVDSNHVLVTMKEGDDKTEEEKEILHLKILKDYYVNMGIIDRFTPAEMKWYESYEEAAAV
jgi:hypothetical protein